MCFCCPNGYYINPCLNKLSTLYANLVTGSLLVSSGHNENIR
jgi:hypothetical protein